jgi:hypothetical protein
MNNIYVHNIIEPGKNPVYFVVFSTQNSNVDVPVAEKCVIFFLIL